MRHGRCLCTPLVRVPARSALRRNNEWSMLAIDARRTALIVAAAATLAHFQLLSENLCLLPCFRIVALRHHGSRSSDVARASLQASRH